MGKKLSLREAAWLTQDPKAIMKQGWSYVFLVKNLYLGHGTRWARGAVWCCFQQANSLF